MLDEFLSFLEEDCPGIVFLDRSLFVASASASHMRNHEVDRGDNEEKVRFAFFSFPLSQFSCCLPSMVPRGCRGDRRYAGFDGSWYQGERNHNWKR